MDNRCDTGVEVEIDVEKKGEITHYRSVRRMDYDEDAVAAMV